jgi:hypothetical protein
MHLWCTPQAPKYDLSLEREITLKIQALKHLPHESWKDFVYWDVELEA